VRRVGLRRGEGVIEVFLMDFFFVFSCVIWNVKRELREEKVNNSEAWSEDVLRECVESRMGLYEAVVRIDDRASKFFSLRLDKIC